MPKIKLLKVMPNPYHCPPDHEGRPHGGVVFEPSWTRGGGPGDSNLRHVGCRIVATQLREADAASQTSDDWDHAWEYTTVPVLVPQTAYYLKALREHALLAADEEAHQAAFGTRAGFVDPELRLARMVSERGGQMPSPAQPWGEMLKPHLEAIERERAQSPRVDAHEGAR